MKLNTKLIAVNAMVAGLYVIFTMPFGTLAVNPFVQIRPAEALMILPALCPQTVVGLAIGCAISNIISTFGILDVLLGTLATLLAGLLTAKVFKKSYLAPLPPIIVNAIILPLVWIVAGGIKATLQTWALVTLGIAVSQTVVCYGLGMPLYFVAKKHLLPFLNS